MAVALIVAAGRGERLGLGPKAFVPLAGRPMLEWSVAALLEVAGVDEIVVALPLEHVDSAPPGTVAVAGGEFRSQSVRAALKASGSGDPVIVHDAARPLAAPRLFEEVLAEIAASGAEGVVAAAPVTDTIKEAGADGRTVARTLERGRLWAIQTPQVFRRAALESALDQPDAVLREATDDAWLIERAGGTVRLLDAGQPNIKVTTELELPGWPRRCSNGDDPSATMIQTGIGYDCHRFAPGRRLVLGGVEIAHTHGLDGHSDADVLTHAVIDALLGAAALGDIGQHFPDTDQRYRDADSLGLLRSAVELVHAEGLELVNVDATIVIERPAVAPHRDAIRARLADALGVDIGRVSVKATRGEGMGFVGREEGAAALAVATLWRAVGDQ